MNLTKKHQIRSRLKQIERLVDEIEEITSDVKTDDNRVILSLIDHVKETGNEARKALLKLPFILNNRS